MRSGEYFVAMTAFVLSYIPVLIWHLCLGLYFGIRKAWAIHRSWLFIVFGKN